jgi:2-(1,2-epoxy-1,2-dihydrophenyl)acetyl-CoA isomerase
MAYDTILVDVSDDGVVTVTMNRPDRLNALNPQMVEELGEAFTGFARSLPRVMVLTGAGRGFCAGADLLASTFDGEGQRGDSVAASMKARFNPMVEALHNVPCPKIAAVNGVAAGGGASLALLCDLVVAARSASFIQVFGPKLGLVPDLGGTWLLPRLAGRARARGMALLGDKIDAATAAEWGMIWQAVADDQLAATVAGLADRLKTGPTRAFHQIGIELDAALDQDLPGQLERERQAQRQLANTADFEEALKAFAEKRPPRFENR